MASSRGAEAARTDLRSSAAQKAADINAVIDVFSAQRLLVLGKDSIEILMTFCCRPGNSSGTGLEDDQLDRTLYSQMVTDADTMGHQPPGLLLLYRPGRLATIDAATSRWQDAPGRYPPLPATSKAFLSAAHHAARRGSQAAAEWFRHPRLADRTGGGGIGRRLQSACRGGPAT